MIKKMLTTVLLITAGVVAWAQEPFSFKYFPIPNAACNCSSLEVEQFQQSIAQAMNETVLYRRELKPNYDTNQQFIAALGNQLKTMLAERSALRKAANDEYRQKIEVLHFRLSQAEEKERVKLKEKLEKELNRYCIKYTKRQTKMIQKQLNRLKPLRHWFSDLQTSGKYIVPDEVKLSVSDFDLYLMYLETMGKVFDFRLETSTRADE